MRLSTDDIKISYVDSDDDLIPVDSEMEFRECLKFSRVRARRGRKVVMKISMTSNGAKPKESGKLGDAGTAQPVKPKLFCLKKKDMSEKKKYVSFDKENGENEEKVPEWFESYMTKVRLFLIIFPQSNATRIVSVAVQSRSRPGDIRAGYIKRYSPVATSQPKFEASAHRIMLRQAPRGARNRKTQEEEENARRGQL